jgi:hypothetical protein
VSFLLLMACGQLITNNGGNVIVTWVDAPPCAVIEGSTTLTNWVPLKRVESLDGPYSQVISYPIPERHKPKQFWRLRACQ